MVQYQNVTDQAEGVSISEKYIFNDDPAKAIKIE